MDLLPANRSFESRVALIDAQSDLRLTYAELRVRIEQEARKLEGEKSLCFVYARNDADSVIAYLAGSARHAVALIGEGLHPELQRDLENCYRPEWIWKGDWHHANSRGPELHRELTLLLSTSGSTGSPKFVRLSANAVVSNAKAIAEALGIDEHDCAPTSLPIHYAYGLSVLNSHLCKGATVVLTSESVVSERFWTALKEHRCTSFAGVPYTYQMLRRLNLDALLPSSMRTLTQAGGRMDPRLVREFHDRITRRSGQLFVMYGQTEATARIAILPPSALPEAAEAVGLAVPGGSLEIVGAPGDVGEVVYRGPNVMMGYATERADLSKPDELKGVLRTGDLGFIDAHGHLRIVGRASRIAKLFGLRISLDELEQLVKGTSEVPVAAVASENKIRIFLEKPPTGFLEERKQFVANRLSLHPSGLSFTPVEALPRNGVGKIDFRALEKEAAP